MYRRIRLAADRARAKPQAQAIVLFEKTRRLPAGYAGLDDAVQGELSAALKRPEFSAAAGAVNCLYPKKGPGRLYVLGLGGRDRFDHGAPLRTATAKLVKTAHAAQVQRLALALRPGLDGRIKPDAAGRAAGDGLALANFQFDEFKGKAQRGDGNKPAKPDSLQLSVTIDSPMRKGLEHALLVGESVNLTRQLAASPPNVANPAHIVRHCRRMARQVGLKCNVIDARRTADLKMGGLVAVGAAGSTPPALICLEHAPRGTAGQPPVMLVGKAVTFDTGGYSLKPAASMDGMKYDKCGGMAVIGIMHALARLKTPRRVVALIPTAENLVSEKGYRPGDILRMYNGTTVEVTNTDAEGRLILADALAYGCKTYRPQAVIDMATLTGGVVVALGTVCAGAFFSDPRWRSRLHEAAEQTGERIWHLPLWREHKQLLESDHADLVNAGGREAHPIQGAAFLSHFVDDKTPWVHLDVAGVADVKKPTDLFTKGPTGFGVRLIVRAIELLK